MGYVLGLDLGTSFTAAVVREAESSRVVSLGNRSSAVPTAAFVRVDGSLTFGDDAVLAGRSQPARLISDVKRRLGGPRQLSIGGLSLDPIDLVTQYLRWAVERIVEREGARPTGAVVTHPATWGAMRRRDFAAAVSASGLEHAQLQTEPVAAAVFHSAQHVFDEGAPLAVYDLGGGTFDSAIIRWSSFGLELCGPPQGIDHLGGLELDEAIQLIVRRHLGTAFADAQSSGTEAADMSLANLVNECVAAKEALSTEPEVDIPVLLPGLSRIVRIRRDEYELLIRPAVDDTLTALRQALDAARVQPRDLAAVLAVGGASRTPLVLRLLNELVGPDVPILRSEPKLAVAKGAAIIAESLAVG